MNNLLILGASGFIGRNILQQLLSNIDNIQSFDHIYLVSRSKPDISLNNSKLTYISCDLLNINDVNNLCNTHDFHQVVHSIQFKNFPVEQPWKGAEYTFHGTDYQSLDNILQALYTHNKLSNIQRYIYFSGANIDHPSNRQYPWAQTKLHCEKLLKKYLPDQYLIIRPSWIYGIEDKSMNKLRFFAKYLPFFPQIGNGQNIINPVHIEDISLIISNIIRDSNLNEYIADILDIGSVPITMDDLAKALLKQYKAGYKPIIHHPKSLMKAIGLIMQYIAPVMGLSPDSIEFITMAQDNTVEFSKSIAHVDIRDFI